jgi:diaminopimelate epimerase
MYKFEKYHGLGNDFILINYQDNIDYSKLAIKLCKRQINIGADGLIIVKNNPLEMIFYNQDGSRAPMCGNGIRCFALYCYNHNLIDTDTFDVSTLAGIMKINITNKDPFEVKVNMGEPVFNKESIGLTTDYTTPLMINNIEVYSLFMGTIHSIVFVDSADDIKNSSIGKLIESHPYFAKKTNVNFVQILDNNNLKINTYERGVGFTLACGTGCSASVVISSKYKQTNRKCNCHLKYGKLKIEVNDQVYMTGPATKVCEGEYYV